MASLSSEKKAQLKKLQSVLKKTVEQYQIAEKNIGKLTVYLDETRDQLDLPPTTKKNRSKIQQARERIPNITSKLDYQKESADKLHEQIIALRSSIDKLSTAKQAPTDIAQGAEQDPKALDKAVKVNAAKDKVSQLTAALKKQSAIAKRENDLLAHYQEQKAQFESAIKKYEPDSEEYAFEQDNIKVSTQAISGQQELIIKEENKVAKLKDALKAQQKIIKDLS